MDAATRLKATKCDPRSLAIGMREAFFLSQLDGRLTLSDVAEITHLSMDEAIQIAERLVLIGAATVDGPKLRRIDPRAEVESLRPPPAKPSLRPAKPAKGASNRPGKPKSRKSLAAQRAQPQPQPRAAEDPTKTDLDEETVRALRDLDAKIATVDHYAALEIERSADKKAIKRAYFGYAAKYHPDRFFGKKLGPMRALLERIFERLTEAHDTLTDPDLRASYDARLPRPRTSKAPPPHGARRPSKPMRTLSRKLAAVVATPPAVVGSEGDVLATGMRRKFAAPEERSTPADAPSANAGPPSDMLKKHLRAAASEIKAQSTIDLLIKAADDAMAAGDVVGAANNLRLALSHRDDPYIRLRFDEVDARARVITFDKNMAPAQVCEREERWSDAAIFFARAHAARPDADVAARAANALRRGGGDLARAMRLAEDAVSLQPNHVQHRITLCEVQIAAKKLSRAEDTLAAARALAPKDARVKELTAILANLAKGKV